VGTQRLTCGQPATRPSSAQVSPKREDHTSWVAGWLVSGLVARLAAAPHRIVDNRSVDREEH